MNYSLKQSGMQMSFIISEAVDMDLGYKFYKWYG